MMIEEAIMSARIAVHRIDVRGVISCNDAERMNKYICALSHSVHPEGDNTKAGHDARVAIKTLIGQAVEEEIRSIRGQ